MENFSLAVSASKENLPGMSYRKIVVMDNQECVFIDIYSIIYAEAKGSYCILYLKNGKSMLTSKNLKALYEKLPASQFLRVHKSFLVNVDYISKYVKSDGGYLIMDNGNNIPVASRRKETMSSFISRVAL